MPITPQDEWAALVDVFFDPDGDWFKPTFNVWRWSDMAGEYIMLIRGHYDLVISITGRLVAASPVNPSLVPF